jgi:predicted ABC-type sugar transport system permease subunit
MQRLFCRKPAVDVELQGGEAGVEAVLLDQLLMGAGGDHPALVHDHDVLAGFSGGAALNMGEEYLLSSIAVVVIGGTSVAGGFANVPGLWGAALFLFLLVTMLNTFGAGAGVRMILTGLIIIGVIVAASGNKAKA